MRKPMKSRYRLIRRGQRSRKYYCVDTLTGKRASLGTEDGDAAAQLVLARNQAVRQPALNLQIAKAYLAGSDSGVARRTFQHALDAIVSSKQGANHLRWRTAARDHAFDLIQDKIIVETPPEALLQVSGVTCHLLSVNAIRPAVGNRPSLLNALYAVGRPAPPATRNRSGHFRAASMGITGLQWSKGPGGTVSRRRDS